MAVIHKREVAAGKPGMSLLRGHPEAAKGVRPKRVLGMTSLALIDVAAVISLRNLPTAAEYGWGSLFIFGLALLGFMIPISFAAAELASGWAETGGVYVWVREAFGNKSGAVAIWADWAENLVWFPTVLSFIAASLAYLLVPSWANNKVWLFIVMMIVFWGTTVANFFGVRASARISSWGTVIGSVIPGVLLIGLGIGWVASGHPLAAQYHGAKSLMPGLNLSNLVFFSGVILAFAGMEMAGFHAREAKNPKKDFPKATLLACVVLVALYVLGTLAIAVVVPQSKIELNSGLLQAFQVFFNKFGVGWLTRPMSLLIFAGGIALLSTWMYGPARGFMRASFEGDFPRAFQGHNKQLAPTSVLWIQAGVGTLFALLFLFEPTVSSAYWILSALTTQLLVIMYVLMFAAVIRLRYTQPDRPRPYKIPGGKLGVWLMAGLGVAGCVFAFYVGFVPPSQISTGNHTLYVSLMILFTAVLALPPIAISWFRKDSWKADKETLAAVQASEDED
ncbi:MAG TPA: amino acid permease [Streptosporangiaceae bacterium]|jgi:glutamate:GABA antiporter|nr:amino acid permease [Streptosporangiaceae bacterium]